MAKNISLLGADYPDVPAVQLPQTGGGTATFYDINVVDNLNSDSSTDALSAKQGKVLKSNIDNLSGKIIANQSDLNQAIYSMISSAVRFKVLIIADSTKNNIISSAVNESVLTVFVMHDQLAWLNHPYFLAYGDKNIYVGMLEYSSNNVSIYGSVRKATVTTV